MAQPNPAKPNTAPKNTAPQGTARAPDKRSGGAPSDPTHAAAPERRARAISQGQDRPPLYVAIVGHVDHGKSTLVGRLLHETGSLPDGKVEAVEDMCRRRGMPFEWAFVTDALKAERDQGITIDVSHIRLGTELRKYVLVDAPGHREFLKNMISGAAQSDAALLVIDAVEGVQEQSRRHGYLLHLLGLSQVIVAVNKMDLVGYDEARFNEIEHDYRAYLASIGVTPTHVVPVSARHGDGVSEAPEKMLWYDGPTVKDALDALAAPMPPRELALRLPVQDVYKFDERRIIAGRIECGKLRAGDRLLFSPSNKITKVRAIESWNRHDPVLAAHAGQSVGITLEDQIFVERGEVISHVEAPPIETNVFKARLFWMGKQALRAGDTLTLKLHTFSGPVRVESIERVIDTGTLSEGAAETVERDGIAEVVLRSRAMLALDSFDTNPRLGRFVLVDRYDVVGGGIISMDGYPDQRELITVRSTNIKAVEHAVTTDMRALQNGHRPGVLWLTGLSGAGKSTLAIALEQALFRKGYQVYVLDGDNVRQGLNANLGFSPEDRAENIRRVGEVAALFAQAGVLVVTAFISPYRSDRQRAREAAGESFREIHIKADLETCEGRDPKGLYAKARSGEIAEFTGISAPYEAPESPDFTVDTSSLSVDEALEQLLAYVEREFEITVRR
jgi:bifunctional enzyme CysN/CysC